MTADSQHRMLELLAASDDGCTDVLLLAQAPGRSAMKLEAQLLILSLYFGIDVALEIEDDGDGSAIFHCRFAPPNSVVVLFQSGDM